MVRNVSGKVSVVALVCGLFIIGLLGFIFWLKPGILSDPRDKLVIGIIILPLLLAIWGMTRIFRSRPKKQSYPQTNMPPPSPTSQLGLYLALSFSIGALVQVWAFLAFDLFHFRSSNDWDITGLFYGPAAWLFSLPILMWVGARKKTAVIFGYFVTLAVFFLVVLLILNSNYNRY